MTSFLDSTALPLAKPISDHIPCMIKIGTSIPKSKVFRFENYWLKHSSFKDIVQAAWNIPVGFYDPAKKINAKFKKSEESTETVGQKPLLYEKAD